MATLRLCPTNTNKVWQTAGIPLLILLLSTWLRFHNLGHQSFWNDEGNSARLSERSIPLIIEGTASDVHPPLYYLILRGWRELVGESEFGLRSLSAFAGILTVAGVMGLVKNKDATLKKRWHLGVLIAGIFAALHPALIYYSQETRMYALLGLWAVFSTLILNKLSFPRRRESTLPEKMDTCLRRYATSKVTKWAAYSLLTTAGIYTHYFYPVVIAWQLLFILWRGWGKRGAVWKPVTALGVAGILYLPWLPIFLRQATVRQATGESIGMFLQNAGNWLWFGHTTAWNFGAELLLLFILLPLTITFSQHKQEVETRRFLPAFAIFLPLLTMLISGATRPAFYKFLLVAVPFLAVGMGLLWQTTQGKNLRQGGLIIVFATILWGDVGSLQNLYHNLDFARADYRGMAARIAADGHENAGIILDAPNQWEVFTYYHKDGAPVYPLPRSDPDPVKIEAELNDIISRHDRIYALFWGEAERDPERLVESWLDQHAFKAVDEWVGGVRFVTYAVPSTPATNPDIQLNLSFGNIIQLQGFALTKKSLAPGDIIETTLFWKTNQPITDRYKVFLHLVGPDGLIAQRDSEPGGGLALTTTWQTGTTIVDNHGVLLPASTPSGDYTLFVGLYPLGEADNRLLIDGQEGLLDAWPLATIHVK